jgi:protein-S-isoprenylcysteine O-methyltransferase Ste14
MEIVESLEPVGYLFCGVCLTLMIAGFLVKKGYLSVLGSFGLQLPTFSIFASSMFGLTGIGVLTVLWYPLGQMYGGALDFGSIVYLPYELLAILFHGSGLVAGHILSVVVMGTGLTFLFLGVLSWFIGKLEKHVVVDFSLYKYTRHPQYLGFLLWSYGLLTSQTILYSRMHESLGFAKLSGLPWLLSTLFILAAAMCEEIDLVKSHGRECTTYREKTPFMIPLPRAVLRIVKFPLRLLLKKDYPENVWEVILITAVYGGILVLLSYAFSAVTT